MIAIRVVSRAGEAPSAPLAAVFGDAGGDIGRGADCTLVLPDPERRISRKHLQVATRAGRHLLRLISTNLLVELNGVPLAPGVEYLLDDAAEIRIGPFVLQAGSGTRPVAAAKADDSLDLLAPPRTASRLSVFHDLLHADEAPRATPAEIDLVVGDTSEYGAPGARPALSASADELVAALYAGLGMTVPPPEAGSTQQMRLVGALLRSTVAGTLSLLASRTIAKRELGANPTLPQSRQNNPLKFSHHVDAALSRLLGPPQRGFIAPLAAVDAAFDDLRAHELAVIAGMRAALEAVLARFNPQTLESRLAGKGVWENLVPVNHKARLWERYGEQHAEMLREIEDDFDSIFGRAFSEAYEAQLARLDAPPRG
ncbi:type VI secretion system-associated FHA domain protein TagH [Piscinibacter sp. XHJ-5]|uniref:type VI secretion system-associated FHA domain protein TagH n=1 Tax=Piscinibacter sp. XHJ-5 TaxID=3037797 RepID=UPI002452C75E|nr:type VI secretion system-associated FHA domain protein TagH [Piscinibacter sp. XHJ-5]